MACRYRIQQAHSCRDWLVLGVLLLWFAAAHAAGGLGLHVVDAPQGGATITAVLPGSPAENVGIEVGDVIVAVNSQALANAQELVALVRAQPPQLPLELKVSRAGWTRSFQLSLATTAVAPERENPEQGNTESHQQREWERQGEHHAHAGQFAVAGRSDGQKAIIAVGDFQVKAAQATTEIGAGLREMLLTALLKSGYFIVVERMDVQGLAAERGLSRSRVARPDSAVPDGRMDVAEIMVYAAVTEFEPRAKSANWFNVIPKAPLAISQKYNESHMALDVRVVDVASGRVLTTQRIPGLAITTQASVSTVLPGAAVGVPVSLSMYRSTPMELAIRDCIQKSVMYVVNNTPQDYFRHR